MTDINLPPIVNENTADERELAVAFIVRRLTDPQDVLAMLGLVTE